MADVTTLIDQVSARIDDTSLQADAFLTALLEAVNVSLGNGFNIDNLLPNSYNYQAAPIVNVPLVLSAQRPTLSPASDAAGPPEAPSIILPTFEEIALPNDDLLVPTNEFSYFEPAYDTALRDSLKAKILNDLAYGGYGIDVNDEAALLQRTRDREAALALTRIDEAGRGMAARGFPLPPDALQDQIDRSYEEYQGKVSSVSRDIYLDRAKRFVDNRQFIMQQARELEIVLVGFHNSVQERALNAARATQEFAIAVYNALVLRFRARLEAAKNTADVQLAQVQALAERNRIGLEMFRAQIAAYEANLRRLIDGARAQVELYQADIAADRTLMDGIIARATLQQKVLEATVQQNIQISQLAIENAKAKLMARVEELKIRLGGIQYASDKYYALLTSMQNSINTLAVQTAEE